jgi:hypothetical protein
MNSRAQFVSRIVAVLIPLLPIGTCAGTTTVQAQIGMAPAAAPLTMRPFRPGDAFQYPPFRDQHVPIRSVQDRLQHTLENSANRRRGWIWIGAGIGAAAGLGIALHRRRNWPEGCLNCELELVVLPGAGAFVGGLVGWLASVPRREPPDDDTAAPELGLAATRR